MDQGLARDNEAHTDSCPQGRGKAIDNTSRHLEQYEYYICAEMKLWITKALSLVCICNPCFEPVAMDVFKMHRLPRIFRSNLENLLETFEVGQCRL